MAFDEKRSLWGNQASVILGSDPEIFFERAGSIVGAEGVLPNGQDYYGLGFQQNMDYWINLVINTRKHTPSYLSQYTPDRDGYIKYNKDNNRVMNTVALDGVQAELHMPPFGCRAQMGNNFGSVFLMVAEVLKGRPETVSFKPVIEVADAEWATLSEKSKQLGCAPSSNVYDDSATIGVDPLEYRIRSAGGHIHIGSATAQKEPIKVVKALDYILGNTCVLLDRDPLAAKRREVYGRAGEHRTPKHGVEYRVLSNFWLLSYPLMSFVMGVARTACHIVQAQLNIKSEAEVKAAEEAYLKQLEPQLKMYREGYRDCYDRPVPPMSKEKYEAWVEQCLRNFRAMQPKGFPAFDELMSLVKAEDIRAAINHNDFDLALANWQPIKAWLHEVCPPWPRPGTDHLIPFDARYTGKIDALAEVGIHSVWPEKDILKRWLKLNDGHQQGWEAFIAAWNAEAALKKHREGQPKPQPRDEKGRFIKSKAA